MILIDLPDDKVDAHIEKDFWEIPHDLISQQDRVKLIQSANDRSTVRISVLFWPADGTEFIQDALVETISPCFKLKMVGELSIPTFPRSRKNSPPDF